MANHTLTQKTKVSRNAGRTSEPLVWFLSSSSLQALTYKGFYDENLEWVSLENIQVVASMSTGGTVGSHSLTSRFSSIVRICTIE